jgi:hypothetical protein
VETAVKERAPHEPSGCPSNAERVTFALLEAIAKEIKEAVQEDREARGLP